MGCLHVCFCLCGVLVPAQAFKGICYIAAWKGSLLVLEFLFLGHFLRHDLLLLNEGRGSDCSHRRKP